MIEDVEYETTMHSKSNFFYKNLVSQKCTRPASEQHGCDKLNVRIEDFEKAYLLKVLRIKDKKISEMNFKILHNILPCNKNLNLWKKSNSVNCTICSQEETIEHLLYSCHYAQCT